MFRWEESEPNYEIRIKRLERRVGILLALVVVNIALGIEINVLQARTDSSQNSALDSLLTIVRDQASFNTEKNKTDQLQNQTIGILSNDHAHAPRRK